MGDVVEAYDRRLSRRVALKRLRADLDDPKARDRFVREVISGAGVAHPNVVTVYDVGDSDGRPYYVMELVEGETLADKIQREGPIPPAEACRIIIAVLEGLAAAHAKGLVHRDVKPGNVLLANDGSVKLADFGIAKAVSDAAFDLTAPGEVIGTPTYLAPEQTRGGEVGPRSDVYAAGVVLYEMLAGAPPFKADSPVATALAHRESPVPPLRERAPGVPATLAAVVDRALAKDPDERFPDAAAMCAALESDTNEVAPTAPVTVSESVTQTRVLPAPPPRTGAPAKPAPRRPRRRRMPAAAVLVIATLLALGAIAAGFALRSGGGVGTEAAGAGAAGAASTLATSTTTTTVPAPRTMDELVAVLAGNPSAYGPRGPELLSALSELQQDPSPHDAADLSKAITAWIASGQLDREVGGIAQMLLAPIELVPVAPAPDQHQRDEKGKKGKND
jgi:eukaryotic-like serine/threonine-protein kinase